MPTDQKYGLYDYRIRYDIETKTRCSTVEYWCVPSHIFSPDGPSDCIWIIPGTYIEPQPEQ